jgi:hypothetical protein
MAITLVTGRISGEAQLREAAQGSFQQIMNLLASALRTLMVLQGDADPWPYVKDVFPDSVVVCRDGADWRYPYSYDAAANTVTLGDPVQVLQIYQAVSGSSGGAGATPVTEAQRGAFLEAVKDSAGKVGGRYRVRIIRAGKSGNGNYYPDAVLREAAPLFEGARVFAKSDEEHLAGRGKDVRNLIGGISAPVFVEGQGADAGELQGTFTVIEPDGPMGSKLREAYARGLTHLFGFSIDAEAKARPRQVGGEKLREAVKFTKVKSVDLIVEPGAGGQIISLTEALNEDLMKRDELIRLIEAKRPDLLRGKDVAKLTDEEIVALAGDAMTAGTDTKPGVTEERLREALRMVEAKSAMRAAIAGSTLPPASKAKLTAQYEGLASFTEAQVADAIKG